MMVETPTRVVERVIGHEFDDLQRAMVTGEAGWQGHLGRLRARERRRMLEDTVCENGKHGRTLNRDRPARCRAGSDDRLGGQPAGVGRRDCDPVVSRMENLLVDRDRDRFPLRVYGHGAGRSATALVTARTELLRAPQRILGHPGCWLIEREVRARRGWRQGARERRDERRGKELLHDSSV